MREQDTHTHIQCILYDAKEDTLIFKKTWWLSLGK